MARWRTVARWFIDRRFQLTYLNEEALVVPRACDKPEFGPCALVAATLLTDWGRRTDCGRRGGGGRYPPLKGTW